MISNNLGVIVMKVTEVNQIDISTLSPGIYVIRSSTGDLKRLVIQ
ncbi:MAG: T9SS type A sorting domain-containing protein [Flammeovirgaceae bacterium]|nr:T9SS type A sorting domain-containing protein [Flammeovirgaceae bacterium]